MLKRTAEVRAIDDVLARARTGPAALVLEGEAGIGKTTQMIGAADAAERLGFRVLSAQGSPTEVTYAFAAIADLLGGIDPTVLESLPETQRIALKRACSGEITGAGPATDERMVATAFLSMVEQVGTQRPVLLAIDDAQWLDASSRAVISYAARRLTGPVGLVLSFRTGDPDVDPGASWLQFRRPETVRRMRMQPLSLGALHTLVAARVGRTLPRPTITRIFEISGGNPLFALELAAGAADDIGATTVALPDSLAALVQRRIGDVDDDAAAVLLAASCSVAPTVESIAAATETSTRDVVEVLESMENLRIVVLEGNRVRFTHPLFATGVYVSAGPARRRAMHRTLAGLVERPEESARHLALTAATADASTLSALDAAAAGAVAQGAPAVGAELLELALKLGGDDLWRRIRVGELHFRAGSLVAARAHLLAALAEAPPGAMRCMGLMWLGGLKAYDDDIGGAVEAMSSAVEESDGDDALGLLCLLRLAYMLVMADRLGDALQRAEKAVEIADRLGIPALRSQALSIWVIGKLVAGQGADYEALQTALDTEDPNAGATTFFQASATQAVISALTGDLDRARSQIRVVQQRMRDGGTEVDIIWAAGRAASFEVWSGRYAEAARAAQEAVEHAEQMGGSLVLVAAWTQQAAAAAYSGREAEARAAARASIDTAYQIGATRLAKEPTNSLAFLEVSLGNYAAALAVLQPYFDAFDTSGGTEIEGGGHLPDMIEALSMLGRADDAEPLVEALERNGARHDRAWMLAMGARGRSHILAARGDLAGAQLAAERALSHHRRLPMPFEMARTQLLLGQLQRRRRRQNAAETLREALETFERLGTPLWAQRASAELGRLDGGPRSGGQTLTSAEQRVADLAATGQSNKQIAAELFIAEKTVETNLSRVYRKLGIRSRAGLSGALRGHHVQGDP